MSTYFFSMISIDWTDFGCYLAVVAVGLVLLIWSADKFVQGAASVARFFGMSPLLIGMIIVGFGTSMPEMCVSVIAAIKGSPGIALGNAYGSNIANIALIIGVTAMICPMLICKSIGLRELPSLLAITVIELLLVMDKHVSRLDGFLMIVLFLIVMFLLSRKSGESKQEVEEEAMDVDKPKTNKAIIMSFVWLFLGLSVLIASSRILVWGSVKIATMFGVDDVIIGLTIVAIGTSLPELASSISAAIKKEHDIALGNVIGSNIFNTLMVVGLASVVKPFGFVDEILYRDFVVMISLTIALFVPIFIPFFKSKINRISGAFLLLLYLAYTGVLVAQVLSDK